MEIRKISRSGSRSLENAEFSHFTLLFAEDGKEMYHARFTTHVHSHCSAH